jgi:hypothetical protein
VCHDLPDLGFGRYHVAALLQVYAMALREPRNSFHDPSLCASRGFPSILPRQRPIRRRECTSRDLTFVCQECRTRSIHVAHLRLSYIAQQPCCLTRSTTPPRSIAPVFLTSYRLISIEDPVSHYIDMQHRSCYYPDYHFPLTTSLTITISCTSCRTLSNLDKILMFS